MNGVPRRLNLRYVSSVRLHDVPEVTWGRLIHVGTAVRLYPANVLIADPNMHVGRFESVYPDVYHEVKLPLYRHLISATCLAYAYMMSRKLPGGG